MTLSLNVGAGYYGTFSLIRIENFDSLLGLEGDQFPYDASASLDTDGDGKPNEWNEGNDGSLVAQLDLDDDGDEIEDAAEVATDPLLADTDADSANDKLDNCPLIANEDQLDTTRMVQAMLVMPMTTAMVSKDVDAFCVGQG